jgi:hypothetical protein
MTTSKVLMVNQLQAQPSRRQHVRVYGPFDGYRIGLLDTPVRIFDLSMGGCFVNSLHEQRVGSRFKLKIELPEVGWITVNAETIYRRPTGFAVQFLDANSETRRRLERGIAAVLEEQSGAVKRHEQSSQM